MKLWRVRPRGRSGSETFPMSNLLAIPGEDKKRKLMASLAKSYGHSLSLGRSGSITGLTGFLEYTS